MAYIFSTGEIKTSLSPITFGLLIKPRTQPMFRGRTFWCCKCLNTLSSRYACLEITIELNGFVIFLIATIWRVSWSLAALKFTCQSVYHKCIIYQIEITIPDKATCTNVNRLKIGVSDRLLGGYTTNSCICNTHLVVTSNDAPMIWRYLYSAMLMVVLIGMEARCCAWGQIG